MTTERPGSPDLKSLVLVPAVITLAVTLLRLVGELLQWSPTFFSRSAGGGFALVGIVWLVPLFAIYFARRIAQAGSTPGGGRTIGYSVLGIAIVVGSGYLASVLKMSPNGVFVVILVGCVVAAWLAHRSWPALGRTLLAYGLAARVPVVLVMLVAIYANWGTHYDVPPPNFPPSDPLPKWFFIGFLPQIFLWVPFTMVVGALFGGLTVLAVGRGQQPARA